MKSLVLAPILGILTLSACVSSKKIESLNLTETPAPKSARSPADADPAQWKIKGDLFETIKNSNIVDELKKARLSKFHLDVFAQLKVDANAKQDLRSLNISFENNSGDRGPIQVENDKAYAALDYSGSTYAPKAEKDFFNDSTMDQDAWKNFLSTHQNLNAESVYRLYAQAENDFIQVATQTSKACSGMIRFSCSDDLIQSYKANRLKYGFTARLLRQKIEKESIPNADTILQESRFYKNGSTIVMSQTPRNPSRMLYIRLNKSNFEYTAQLHTLIALRNMKNMVVCVDITEDETPHINCVIK